MIQNEELLINRQLRNDLITDERLGVLDKVKELNCLSNTMLSTVEQVANYYEVGNEAIQSLIKDNREELISNGFRLYKRSEILKITNDTDLNIPNRGINLFNKKSVLYIAMLLTESEVAKKVREELLLTNPALYSELSKCNNLRFKKYEKEIGNYLKFTFGNNNIKEQVTCGKYKLDFILFDIIHIEVDEDGHQGYDKEKEKERTQYILENTEYWTMRYNPMKQKPYQIIKEIFDLFDNIGYPDEMMKDLAN